MERGCDASDPQGVHRQSHQDDGQPERAGARIGGDLAGGDHQRRRREHQRHGGDTVHAVRGRIARAAPQPHEAHRHGGEKDPFRVHDLGEQGAVAPQRHQHRRPQRLEDDRPVRGAEARVHRSQPPEQQPVARHREVDPGTRQDDAGQRAERRGDDQGGDHRTAPLPHQRGRRFGRDSIRGDHTVERQHVEIHGVERDVRRGDGQCPDEQRPGDRAARVARFLRGVRDHVPPAEGEQARRHRRRHGAPPRSRARHARSHEVLRQPPAQPESGDDDRRDGQDLADGEPRLHRAAERHAEIVHGREQQHGADCHGFEPRVAERHEVGDVAGEHHRDGGDDPGVHAPEHRPAPQETERGRIRLAQEHVNTAAQGKRRSELRADQGARQRQHAGEGPHQHDARHRAHLAGDHRGLHENRRADDRPHDHRRGADGADGAPQVTHGVS